MRLEEVRALFRGQVAALREHQVALGTSCLERAPKEWKYSDVVPMLNRQGWLFESPQEIEAVLLEPLRVLEEGPIQSRSDARLFAGLDLAGPITYSSALRLTYPDVDYFNGTIFRPTGVRPVLGDCLTITCEIAHYFDFLDTTEVLAFEESQGYSSLGLRKNIHDPFDLTGRVASLGVLTLTVVKTDENSATFFMHKRSGRFVVGDALYHVVPAGEFTPASISPTEAEADFSIWRNIMREYAEEFLGMPDAQGRGGRPVNYERDEPFTKLDSARVDGSVSIRVFGLALDPLSLKPELLTVAIFKKDAFDDIFGGRLGETDEGVLIERIPFEERSLRRFLEGKETRLGAQACLILAWRNRFELGIC